MVDPDLAERCRQWVEEYSSGTWEAQNPEAHLNNYKPPINIPRQYQHNSNSTPRGPTRRHTFRNLAIAVLSTAGFLTYVCWDYSGQQSKQEAQTSHSFNFSPLEVTERDKRDQEEEKKARAEEAYKQSEEASSVWDDRTARHYITIARENDPDNLVYMIEEARLESRAEIARRAGKTLRGIRDLFR